MRFTRFVFAGLAALIAGTAFPQITELRAESPAWGATRAYVEAINSNDLQAFLAMLTEDVVLMAPNDKPYVGKRAVRPWAAAYLKAYHTHWDKPLQEFVMSGDWAFERYSYTSTDTPAGGGAPLVDTGWGFVTFHHDGDGKWRVARDAWGSDHPPAGSK